MRRGRIGLGLACAVAALSFGSGAFGQVVWQDDFEAYAPGSGIFGQGGWSAWDDDPTWDSFVTTDQANSGSNSLDVKGDSDTVYKFEENLGEISCGEWTLTCMQYVPSDLVAANDTYFILLNTYVPGGTNNWSTQVHHDPDTATIIADFSGETLPSIYDQWVEIKVVIDLDNDTQDFYYGGDLLYSGSWTEQVSGGGQLRLQGMDLFAYGATSVYYDDFQLEQTRDCPPGDCMTLEVDQLVGGLTSKFTITDPNGSNATVALVYGLQDGQTNVNGFAGYCASFGIKGVNQSKLICQKKLTAGVATCSQKIPGNVVGVRVLFQAAMKGTCPDPCMSNLLDLVVQ